MSKEIPSMLAQLKRAVEIAEQIEVLQKELDFLLKSSEAEFRNEGFLATQKERPRKRHNLSPEARERIAAAQRLRWEKYKKAMGS